MFEDWRDVAVWVMVVLSVLVAFALPVVAHRYIRRPGAVREMWLHSKPGRVIGACVVALVVLAALGLLMAALAARYSFMWATVALVAGSMVAVILVLVRFLTHDKSDLV
ncbi:hypothetical protein [Naasia sp. SYSU D00057]|uniref:hypothetical protein n=1 Tax=Naasia sp. SYSU D00057 TaxID=2817380 RepID=UPI001B30888E|nr:hypothetical protein [Naasia sp. SYSU D00057]